MKFKYLVAAAMMGMVVLPSCNNFLDITQENTNPTEAINYQDLSQMYAPVSGVYAVARSKFTQWEIAPIFNIRGDEVTKGGGSDADQHDYLELEHFNYSAIQNFWALNNAWMALYGVVYNTFDNQKLLDNFKPYLKTDKDQALYAQYRGEIVFHRALAYYFIANLWGDAPIIPEDNQMAVVIPKSSQQEIRSSVIDMLKDVLPALPAQQPEHPGAVTKYAAEMLIAKVALQTKDMATVKQMTDDIIANGGFKLVAGAEYSKLFQRDGKLSPESLYEFQYTDFGNASGDNIYGGSWFQSQGPRGGFAPITGWGFGTLEPGFIKFMKDRGEKMRYQVDVLESGKTTPEGDVIPLFNPSYAPYNGDTANYNGKAYNPANQTTPGRTQYGTDNNIRLFRYADVLLMNAEAKLSLGGDAATPLNQVRHRAGLQAIANPTLDDILNERRAELSVEWGNRFDDLVRTDKAKEVLKGFVKGQSEFLPYPTAQVDLNPELAK
ncbi:RagB/SusD family nutrient uptake outer membrane protein [Persicobacter psychrovividus]|uniref:Membrane protein n=1 Tax=Persicobacter psychrovividus TaxID=387638 RepID=A0ABM7VHW5_9BACT|nr:membrane protein [Persicobacter psychrovividus]